MALGDISNRFPKSATLPEPCLPEKTNSGQVVELQSESLYEIKEEEEVSVQQEPNKIQLFFELLENESVKGLFKYDQCGRFTDCYLIATTAIYFQRMNATSNEYNPQYFLILLELACQMHDDINCYEDIFILYIKKTGLKGEQIRQKSDEWKILKIKLLKRLDYRLHVKINELTELMENNVHRIWSRRRSQSHGGVFRDVNKEIINYFYLQPFRRQKNSTESAICELCSSLMAQDEKQKEMNSKFANIPEERNLLETSDSSQGTPTLADSG